jgi:uncharacterized protein (TIGR02231 family)
MRTFVLIAAAAFAALPVLAQTETSHEVNAPVRSVIIYLTNAEVSHTKQLNLNAGRNRIVFTGLSAKLIPKSIQATATGDVAILSVSEQINFFSKLAENPRIKQLKDSVKLLDESIGRLNGEKDAYQTEKSMLLENKSIGGNEKGVAIAELKLAADFYRSRIKEINAEMQRIDTRLKELNETLARSNQQLFELNAKHNLPTADVTILVNAPAKVTANIDLHYLVTDAAWQANYDLRAEDVDKPIQLTYRARVYNNTGIDWENVKIKLSTADPNKSASKPELDTWYLDYNTGNYNYSGNSQYDNNNYYQQQNAPAQNQSLYEGYMNSTGATDGITIKGKPGAKMEMFKQQTQFEEIQVSELSAEFDIKVPYSIPSDAKPYFVDVTTYNLPANYQHYSVPKMDRDAFLLARITGWEDLDLVEGPANVYYAGTYIGQSYIHTRSVDDTLLLSLGRDNKVVVTRTKQKDLTSVKSLSGSKKETFAYEMVVKNNRKAPISIDLIDQLPISKQNEIEVEAIELSKADQDMATGKLTWKAKKCSSPTRSNTRRTNRFKRGKPFGRRDRNFNYLLSRLKPPDPIAIVSDSDRVI